MLQLACDRLLTITADVRHASSKRPSCKHMAQVVSPPCYPTVIIQVADVSSSGQMASPHGCPHACPRTCTPPPPPCPPASSQPPEQSRHACASQPPLPNLSGALPNDPPPCAVRCPCLVSSRAERTTMAFFVVHASTEGRRVLLSSRKTSRTRATPIRRPIAAWRDRGHTRRSLSLDGYGANTPRGRSSCAPPTGLPPTCENAPKNAPNAPHRQDSTPSLRNAPNAAACLVRVETKRCPTGTAGLLEERSYPP